MSLWNAITSKVFCLWSLMTYCVQCVKTAQCWVFSRTLVGLLKNCGYSKCCAPNGNFWQALLISSFVLFPSKMWAHQNTPPVEYFILLFILLFYFSLCLSELKKTTCTHTYEWFGSQRKWRERKGDDYLSADCCTCTIKLGWSRSWKLQGATYMFHICVFFLYKTCPVKCPLRQQRSSC